MIQDPYNPAPNFANTPPTPPRGRRNLWIAITCAIVLVVAVGTLLMLELLGVFASPASNHSGPNTQPTATTAAGGSTPTSGATTPTTNPSGGSVTPQEATATLTQYYASINAKDYQSAYNMWGSNYRSSTSYATFARGFANTQNDNLQVGNAVALSDGTVKVPVTVTATVADVASTTVNTYQGYYIIGTEGNTWQLFSANIQ